MTESSLQGPKRKTMLASEVSYVMSETNAKDGKASSCGQFLKYCLLEVAKINLSREKDYCRYNYAAKTNAERIMDLTVIVKQLELVL